MTLCQTRSQADLRSSLYDAETLDALTRLPLRAEPMARYKRHAPDGAEDFFSQITGSLFRVVAIIRTAQSERDLDACLAPVLDPAVLAHPFYPLWRADMAAVCRMFADLLMADRVGFVLGTQRGCKRYHMDRVPYRLLVTYQGAGTEWLPHHAADLEAYRSGGKNADIVRDASETRFMDPWDVAVFRGVPDGLLHRTPDAAPAGASLLMRLDDASFWDDVVVPL